MKNKSIVKILQKNQISWIDSAKAICMLLVYVNHCEFYANGDFFNIRPFYRLFFVNLFFFVSGYLFFRKQLSIPVVVENRREYLKGTGLQTFRNIIYRIFLPTIIFGFIFFFPKMIVRGSGFDFSYFFKDVILGNWCWFTSTLFVTELLLVIMLSSRIKSIYFYLFATIALWVIVERISHESNYIWHWQSGIMASSMLVGGGIFWLYEDKIDKVFNNYYIIIFLLILYLWVVYFSGWQMKWFVSDFNFTFWGLVFSIIACILMIYICKRIPKTEWFSFIGKNSLVFYMLCGGYPNIMAILCQKISCNTTLNVVLSTTISVLLAYVTTFFINKYIPFLVDLRKVRMTK